MKPRWIIFIIVICLLVVSAVIAKAEDHDWPTPSWPIIRSVTTEPVIIGEESEKNAGTDYHSESSSVHEFPPL